jgi:ubiquitin-like modifier-activating enzyme ATG7
MLGKAYKKIVITTALGFDSFLVMRHNSVLESDTNPELGCYFCNDYISPIDSSNTRTLDQACTISRPGLSYIASGYTTELCINLVQSKNNLSSHIPHTIRGNIYDYQTHIITSEKFSKCVACSDYVTSSYLTQRKDFLINLMNEKNYLENICKINEMMSDLKLEKELENLEDDF